MTPTGEDAGAVLGTSAISRPWTESRVQSPLCARHGCALPPPKLPANQPFQEAVGRGRRWQRWRPLAAGAEPGRLLCRALPSPSPPPTQCAVSGSAGGAGAKGVEVGTARE